jgi:hypothetical protein
MFAITNKNLDLANHWTFEFEAYVHIIDQSRRNMFGEKSIKCIVVDYAFDSPA